MKLPKDPVPGNPHSNPTSLAYAVRAPLQAGSRAPLAMGAAVLVLSLRLLPWVSVVLVAWMVVGLTLNKSCPGWMPGRWILPWREAAQQALGRRFLDSRRLSEFVLSIEQSAQSRFQSCKLRAVRSRIPLQPRKFFFFFNLPYLSVWSIRLNKSCWSCQAGSAC